MSCTTAASVFTGTMASWRVESKASPPQCAPPMFDGTTSVPSKLGGVKIPSLRNPSMAARHAARSASLRPHT